ncbi:hypothetical protein ACFVUW_11280 [Streptomyces xiamenensis]|uniref:hypothetical protein n=1 Tax=Streptomyces xiamenensis TaxID=408015 RepID=UPI0036F079B0
MRIWVDVAVEQAAADQCQALEDLATAEPATCGDVVDSFTTMRFTADGSSPSPQRLLTQTLPSRASHGHPSHCAHDTAGRLAQPPPPARGDTEMTLPMTHPALGPDRE